MRLTMLSGGVGGARLARGLAAIEDVDLAVIVNVGDDEEYYGLSVSPDLDTVIYTIAGVEGPQGWGIADDTFFTMNRLSRFEMDTVFRVGDRDLASNLVRTSILRSGGTLSEASAKISAAWNVSSRILPVSDDRIRTELLNEEGTWLSFQDYFVARQHRDVISNVRYSGAAEANPAPGVLEAIEQADAVIIGPSNPPLSIWPILAVPGIAEAVGAKTRVLAVSPLFKGQALKGPADKLLASLGLPLGNTAIVSAYSGLLSDLVIDTGDAADRGHLTDKNLMVHVRDTRIAEPRAAAEFASWLIDLL